MFSGLTHEQREHGHCDVRLAIAFVQGNSNPKHLNSHNECVSPSFIFEILSYGVFKLGLTHEKPVLQSLRRKEAITVNSNRSIEIVRRLFDQDLQGYSGQ